MPLFIGFSGNFGYVFELITGACKNKLIIDA